MSDSDKLRKVNKMFTRKDRKPVKKYFLDDDGEPLAEILVEQCHKDDCDINKIIGRYDRHGVLNTVNEAKKWYGDFTEVNEFQQAQELVAKGKTYFEELPSEVRNKFRNDPGNFLEFASDPRNNKEMVKLGLATEIIEPEEKPVRVVVENPNISEESA